MEILDITFDLETTALCPSAGVLSMAAVAWNRMAQKSPWIYPGDSTNSRPETFFQHVNGTSNFVEGRTQDSDTMAWWQRQSKEVKSALFPEDAVTSPPVTLQELLENFFFWIKCLREMYQPKTICLWCQGKDFDIAIIRDIAYKLNETKALNDAIRHTDFRDCRDYVIENGKEFLENPVEGIIDNRKVYDLIPQIQCDFVTKESHNPLYDAVRSTWSVWNIMKMQLK